MPAELFRSVGFRRSSGRRLGAVPLSVAVHGAVLIAAVTIPLFATDVLPPPNIPTILNLPAMPVVPVPMVPAPRAVRPSPASAYRPGAPTVAPVGIHSELAVDTAPPTVRDVPVGELIGTTSLGDLPRETDFVPLPPPPPKAPTIAKAGVDIAPPKKIRDVAPVYPQIAIAARVQGAVVIEAVISTTGTVENVRVVTSVPLLDQAALDAVRQWVYTPTKLRGVPVPVMMSVKVEFRLQ